MDIGVDSIIDLSSYVIILALLLERIRRLEDKIMNCVISRLEDMNERVARIEERLRL